MDWLAVAALWLGTAVFAVKSADLKPEPGFPSFLTSGLWNYAPLILVSIAALLMIFRALVPHRVPSKTADAAEAPLQKNVPTSIPIGSAAFRRHGVPDTRLDEAFGYMCETEWGRANNMDEVAIEREIRDKLQMDLITAFGRIGPDGGPVPIDAPMWESMSLSPHTGHAVMDDKSIVYYDIQFAKRDLRRLWPTWRDTFGLA
jgi:hypothetical protein